MKTDVRTRFSRLTAISAAGLLALASVGLSQQAQPIPGRENAAGEKRREAVQPAREQVRDTAEGARDTNQATREAARDAARDNRGTAQDAREGGREKAQEAREGGRDQARDEREKTRDAREGARDTASENRREVRDARQDVRESRREFRAERVRSGDLGLWLRRAANRLMVSDIAGRGAIVQTGLKEGDEIISVNGQHVANEREFVDRLFAAQDSNQPVPIVVSRNGKQQTIQIQPKTFVDEYMVGDDNSLHQYGIIIDDSVPDHLRVQSVVPRSPAFYAGVKSGDTITGFRGQRINAIVDLVRGLASSTGASAPLEVNRNNQTRQLDIDIPGDSASEPRTVLRPNLQQPGATTQPNNPPPATRKAPADTRPRLNPPR